MSEPYEEENTGKPRIAVWVVGGVSVAALAGGIALNLSARSKMDSCNSNASKGMLQTANEQCNSARPVAYFSYGLFGLAAAGAVVDTILLLKSRTEEDDVLISLHPVPGGGALSAHGRF